MPSPAPLPHRILEILDTAGPSTVAEIAVGVHADEQEVCASLGVLRERRCIVSESGPSAPFSVEFLTDFGRVCLARGAFLPDGPLPPPDDRWWRYGYDGPAGGGAAGGSDS